MLGFTWETPCGLLIQGESAMGRGLVCGDAAYRGVWYCPENDNPLLQCPYEKKDCPFIPAGFPVAECPCHRTERRYDYQQSIEKAEAERRQQLKTSKQYMDIEGGHYCACVVGNSGFQGGLQEVHYDVMDCIGYGCKNQVCLEIRPAWGSMSFGGDSEFSVVCKDCGCGTKGYRDKESAVRSWSRRVRQ